MAETIPRHLRRLPQPARPTGTSCSPTGRAIPIPRGSKCLLPSNLPLPFGFGLTAQDFGAVEAGSPLPASRPPQDPQTPPAPPEGSPATEGTPEPPALYSPRWDPAAPDWLARFSGIGSEQPPALRLVSLLPREAQPGGGARLAGGSWLQPAIGWAWVLLGCDWWRERGGGRSEGKDRWQQAIGCQAVRLRGDWLRAAGGGLRAVFVN